MNLYFNIKSKQHICKYTRKMPCEVVSCLNIHMYYELSVN